MGGVTRMHKAAVAGTICVVLSAWEPSAHWTRGCSCKFLLQVGQVLLKWLKSLRQTFIFNVSLHSPWHLSDSWAQNPPSRVLMEELINNSSGGGTNWHSQPPMTDSQTKGRLTGGWKHSVSRSRNDNAFIWQILCCDWHKHKIWATRHHANLWRGDWGEKEI